MADDKAARSARGAELAAVSCNLALQGEVMDQAHLPAARARKMRCQIRIGIAQDVGLASMKPSLKRATNSNAKVAAGREP
jgi:hypothetical protein